MRVPTSTLAAVLLLPALASADDFGFQMPDIKFQKADDAQLIQEAQQAFRSEQGGDEKFKFKKRATKIAQTDPDFYKLTAEEQDLVIRTIALKLAAYRKSNRERGGPRRYRLRKTTIKITITDDDADLAAMYARYPNLQKKKERDLKKIEREEKDGDFRGREIIREEEVVTPGKTIETPAEPTTRYVNVYSTPAYHNLFDDNEWDVVGCDAEKLEALIDKAVATAGPDGKITRLTIDSSASALRNTGKAEGLSFEQLSKLRAEAARDYIIKYLELKHKISFLPQDADLDWSGENGDGTSGPAGPYPGDGKGSGPAPKGMTIEDYDQHKYVYVSIQVARPEIEPSSDKPTITQEDPTAEGVIIDLNVSGDKVKRLLWWPKRVKASDEPEEQKWSLCRRCGWLGRLLTPGKCAKNQSF